MELAASPLLTARLHHRRNNPVDGSEPLVEPEFWSPQRLAGMATWLAGSALIEAPIARTLMWEHLRRNKWASLKEKLRCYWRQ